VLGFVVQSEAVGRAGVSLGSFHTLIVQDKDVRHITTLCIATGVVPFAALGGIAGRRLAGKRRSSAQ
jgi:hypothetical protein